MPTTTEGAAISSRDATPPDLFAHDASRPHPGEDPEGFQQTNDEFTCQLQPRSLLERHYVEKIAAASWRLRRLHRWQAQLFEDETLMEDERLNKLDKVLRHETNLHRQIDTSVKMLNNDVPRLYAGRAHTDSTPNCQTELDARTTAAPSEGRSSSERDSSPRASSPRAADENCPNEPAPASSDSPRIGGRGVIPSSSPSLTGSGSEPKADTQSCSPEHSQGGSERRGASLTLTAKGRLVPARTDAARRLLFSA